MTAPLLTVDEVATYLGKTRTWVAKEANAQTLPGRKVGRDWRFLQEDVDAYLAAVHNGARDPMAASVQSMSRRRRAS